MVKVFSFLRSLPLRAPSLPTRALPALAAIMALSAAAGSAAADDYRLVIGDSLQVSLLGEQQPMTGTVDLDGFLRFAGLAQSPVAGLTLAEAEAALEADLRATDLYVNPDISLAITSHAPVMVVGEVRRPGSFSYMPQLTVELALGLAGGVSLTGFSSEELALLETDTDGQLRGANLEIIHETVRIARLQAQLQGKTAVQEADIDLAGIPAPLPAVLQTQLEIEQQALDTFLGQAGRQDRLWAQQLQQLDTEIALLADRIAIQQEVVKNRADELESARSLAERGLQRATIVAAQERLESEARARILELEALASRAQSDRISAARAQANFHDLRRLETLEALRNAVSARDRLRQRHENQRRRLAVLSADGAFSASINEVMELSYVIVRRSAAGLARLPAQSGTAILPGDAVIVSALAVNGAGGD